MAIKTLNFLKILRKKPNIVCTKKTYMKNNKKQLETVKQSLNSKSGRFFTLTTKHGDKINAKLVDLTNCYVTVWDNNAKNLRKLALTSVASA